MRRFLIAVGICFASCGDATTSKPDAGTASDMGFEPGVVVIGPLEHMINESGGTSGISVLLGVEPNGEVVLDLTTTDESELTVSPQSLRFSRDNWGRSQVVTLVGVDDDELDGSQLVYVESVVTATGNYANATTPDVAVSVLDNERAEIAVLPTILALTEGESGSISVVLSAAPPEPVVIALSGSNDAQLFIDRSSVTFDAENYSVPQDVNVTAVEDEVAEDEASVFVTFEPEGGRFGDLVLPDVEVAITDNDEAGLVATEQMLVTGEDGSSDTVEIYLRSAPVSPVVVDVASISPTEGTASPTALTFDASNYDRPQQMVVTGVDDAIVDGTQSYTLVLHAASDDTKYDGLTEVVAVANADNDVAGITVSPAQLTVNESGATSATFEVVLIAQPRQQVDVPIAVSAAESTIDVTVLTFYSNNWDVPQTVTVTAVDDARCDGNTAVLAEVGPAASPDAAWSGINPADVSVTVIDDDACDVTVTPIQGLTTTEGGGSDMFSVVLSGEPTADVTIGLSSSDLTEGMLSLTSLTFTSTNWNVPQSVTVSGLDDPDVDGDVSYIVVLDTTQSADPAYDNLDPPNVAVTNQDDD